MADYSDPLFVVSGQVDKILGNDKDQRAQLEAGRKNRNAEEPFFWPKEYFIWDDANNPHGGVTFQTGDIMINHPQAIDSPAEVLGHEEAHRKMGKRYSTTGPQIPKKEVQSIELMRDRMQKEQPGIWPVNLGDNHQEPLAALFGHESNLPKGDRLWNSPPASRVMEGNWRFSPQYMKDTYYNATSGPEGGIWEGQGKPDNPYYQAVDKLFQLFGRK